MMWVFGQVWLLCLLAFVLGAVLYHVLFTRPLRKQVRQLEIQLAKAKRAEAMPPPLPPLPPAESDAERTGIVAEHPPLGQDWDQDRRPSWERDQAAESPRTLIAATPQLEHDLGYDRPYEPEQPAQSYDQAPSFERAPSFEPAQSFEQVPSFEPPQSFGPAQSFEPAEHDYHAEHGHEPEAAPVVEPEPVALHEPEPEPAPELPQPPADEQPTQIQAPVPPPPPIRNPSPAEMTAVINRIAGEANAAETTSILPPARDDHEDMELADHGPGNPAHGQLVYTPADELEDEHLVDDVVEEELTDSEREAAAETTGPVAVSVIAAAEKAVQEQERRLAGELADEEQEQGSRHSLVEEPAELADQSFAPSEQTHTEPEQVYAEPEQVYAEPEPFEEPAPGPQAYSEPPTRQPDRGFTLPEPFADLGGSQSGHQSERVSAFEPIEAFDQMPAFEPQAPEPAPEPAQVQLEELAEPIRLDPNQFGKPIPPGALTPPGSVVTPVEPAESASPLPTRPPRPEPAPMAAVGRARSLFEPVLDPDGDDPYEDLDGFQPIQEPTTRTFSSTDSVPFTPILAPELLATEQPKPPVVTSTSAGLPKRTVSNSWPRGGNGLGAGPQPFDPAPFRPRAAFTAMPRNTDAAPIRRPSSGGPRTPFGPGSALPKPDGSAPSDDYQVKAMLGTRTYHPAGSGDYNAVKAEVWFRNTEEAESAGFRPAQ